MPTLQETFNTVALHLLTQNARSVRICTDDEDDEAAPDGSTCLYRSHDGLKCAVGILIPDELYSRSMEGNACEFDPVLPVLQRLGHDPDLCARLQQVHDSYFPSEWYRQLLDVARTCNLSTDAMEEWRLRDVR